VAAEAIQDFDALFEITELLLARFPNAYLGILYVENDQRDLALRNRYLSLLTFGELASNCDFKMAEARLLDRHGSYADNLAESAAFLANHLSDDEAEWTNANALYDLERFAEAADAYEKEYRAFPFATNLAVKAAWVKALAREEKYDQAKSVAGLTATADSAKIRPVDATAEIILIQGELNAGEKGEARREFEKAIARFPKDPVLQDLGAQIENSSNRPEQAAEHARIAVASDPTNIDYQSHLIQALAKTDGDAALTQFHRALQTVPSPTYSFYYLAASVYSDRKDWRAWTDLWQQAVQLMPHEYNSKDYLARGLAEQGQTQAAFEALRALLQYHTADSWEASHYREYATATMKADLARSAVEQLRLMQPWNQALWSDAASDLAKAKDDAGIDALWAKALASNPTAAWAYEAAIDHLIEEKHWDQANALLGEMNRRQASVGLKEKYVEEHAYFVRERAKEAPEPRRDQLTALTRELDQNRDILGEYSYWWWIWQTGIAAQDEAQRHQGLTRLMECSPDLDKVYDLFDLRGATETDRRKLDRIRRHAVWRYMDRDPYNPAKLETFGERHSQWLGDDVGGLWAYERIEEIDPDYAKKNGIPGRINDNYERLGDSTRALKDYLTYGAIANSDRYLGWFASARAQAEKQLGRTHLEFDPKTVRATITDTDGETVVIEANLRWGKAALLQRGPNWVRATYDDYGNLTSVSNNGGHRVDLVYDNQDRISMMKGAGGGDLRFTYNAHGKPIVMEITGKGRIDVTYDDQDNITKVESDAGRAIALEVTTRFQNLTDLIRPFSNLNVNVVIPSLSTADPEVEDLRQTFKKATRQRDPQQIIDAGLALSGKLVAKIPDQSEYAREAEKVLSELLDAIEQGDLGQSGPDAGVRALALWRELFKQSGRVGLSKEQWEEWFGYRDFFARLAQEGRLSDQSRATLAALVQPPLTLLPSAQWLPSDNLSNPGLWSRVTPGKMVLAPAAGGDLSAVLVRQNGDVVAAGASGLFVRRRGYWRFYHFDAAAGRFSMDRSAKSDPFGVLSLAEDANGALWIGAKSGVIRLDGDYDDAAQVWRSDAEKPFEAAFLILFGDGVLAGGADGLRRFDGTGEKPVVFDPRQAATPVKVLRALPDNDGRSSEAIVGNAHGVFRIGEEATTLSDAPVDDLLWTPSEQLVFELKGGEVWISHWRGKGAFEPAIRLADIAVQGDLGTPGTLTEVPVEGADSIPALLTDKGVALWAYDHLELLAPPGLALGKKIVAIGGASPRLWLATGTAALLSFGTDNVISSDTAGQVYDIIALPAQTAVVIARGENGLQVSRDGRLPEDLADTASTVLANDAAGRLIANDNMDIVRFSANLSKKETLFSAEPSQVPQPQTDSQFHKVSSLLVASDGAIWATAGPSVFRWQDGKVKEFSMFLDSKFFSAKSDAMSRVIETIDHHIWVVASNEGHRRIGSDYLRLESCVSI